MAPIKRTVRLPMAGLDQGVDPKLAQGLLKLENTRQHRRSEFVKRYGLGALTSSFADRNLATYKGRPVQFGNSGVYALNAAGTAMVKVDDAGFFDVDVNPLGIGANAVAQVTGVYEGATVWAVFYQKLNTVSDATTYHLTTYEKVSGRQLDTLTLDSGAAHVFALGSEIVYVTAERDSDDTWTDDFDDASTADWSNSIGNGTITEAGTDRSNIAGLASDCYWLAGSANAPRSTFSLASALDSVDGLITIHAVGLDVYDATNDLEGGGIGLYENDTNVWLARVQAATGDVIRESALADTWATGGSDSGITGLGVAVKILWNNHATDSFDGLNSGDTIAPGYVAIYTSRSVGVWVLVEAIAGLNISPTDIVLFSKNTAAAQSATRLDVNSVTVTLTTKHIAWGNIDTTTGIIAASTVVPAAHSSVTSGEMDACAITDTVFAVVHRVNSDFDAELITVDTSGGGTYAKAAVTAAHSVHAVACWLQDTALVGVAVARSVDDDVEVSTWDTSPAASDAAVTAFTWTLADDKVQELTGIARSATAGDIYMTCGAVTPSIDTDDLGVRVVKQTFSGVGSSLAAGTDALFQEGCRLVSQAFSDAAATTYVVVQRQGTLLEGLGKCIMVINGSGQIVARALMDAAVANHSAVPGYLGAVADRTDRWTFGAAKLVGYETSVPVVIQLEKVVSGIKAVEAHGLLVLPGAHPWVYTGQEVVELGFLHYPVISLVTPAETLAVLNDLVAMYEAHRILGTGDTPPCHNTAGGDTANPIGVTNPATTLAEGIALAGDLRTQYNAHCADGTIEHANDDSANPIGTGNPTDYDTLQTFLTEALTDYANHRTEAAGPGQVHYNDPGGGAANQNDTVNLTTETMDGSMEEGSHGYQSVFERTLTSGHRDQSAPSANVSIDNDADEGVNAIVGELHHTKADATIALYRTEANKATWHRAQRQANNKLAYQATIPDSQADADVASEPNVYTTGNVLSNLPPPPSRAMFVHQERLFALNREDEDADWRYSRKFQDGKGISFNDVLQLKCSPAGGRCTAGATLQGRGVLFKKSSIYSFYGKGLNSLGTGAGYSTPELISPAIGCVNQKTLVETPLGLMFESEDGIYLLSQKFQVVPIGQPVKYHTDNVTLSGVAHVKDLHYVVWSSGSTAIVFDYVYGTWSTYTAYGATDICTNEDHKVFLMDGSETIYYEDRSVWVDVSGEVSVAVPMLARSAWVTAAEYQKLHSVGLIGQARSDCTLRVKIAFDYQLDSNGFPRWAHNLTYDVNALAYHESDDHYGDSGTAGTADNALLLNIQLARRCRSFMIEVSDETRAGQATVTKGISLTGLQLEVSAKRGQLPPGSARQVTS